jgi:hypothetical protein
MANEWWGVVTVIGVWGWIFAGAGFILNSFPARGCFNRKAALVWGVFFLFFYTLWVLGMKMA